jgi:hypothetical protein
MTGILFDRHCPGLDEARLPQAAGLREAVAAVR